MTTPVHPAAPPAPRPVLAAAEANGAELTLDDQLCFALYAASLTMGRLYKPLLDRLGLTCPQYFVLLALWERDGRTVGGIAERLGLESSTVTPLLQRLETAGFVTRERSRVDERTVHVRLTDKGRATRPLSASLGEAVAVRSGMTQAALRGLAAQVRALRHALTSSADAV